MPRVVSPPLASFIPGISASAVNYQAYLLDGITRWNTSHAAAAIDSPNETLRTFDARLEQKVCLYLKYYGRKIPTLTFKVLREKKFHPLKLTTPE